MDLTQLTATQIVRFVRDGEISAPEVVGAFLDRIEEMNPELNAFCLVAHEQARTAAATVTRRGRLAGVPLAVKDLIETSELNTTAGSKTLHGYQPVVNEHSVERLVRAGAVVVGKTNTAEFGQSGARCENDLFGITKNPHDLERTPGGSSGGSAAAVAARLAPIALGTDDGGSIRIPAHFCGVVGLKPTEYDKPIESAAFLGRSPWSVTGPMAGTVRDTALVFEVLSDQHVPLDGRLKSCRIGWFTGDAHEFVAGRVAAAAAVLTDARHHLTRLAPPFPDARDASEVLMTSALARSFDTYEMDVELCTRLVQRRIEIGRAVTPAQLSAAHVAWRRCRAQVDELLADYDLLLTPVATTTAFGLKERRALAWMPFTIPFNVSGSPALSVPFGQTPDGLPCGVQLVASRGDEARLLAAALVLEEAV